MPVGAIGQRGPQRMGRRGPGKSMPRRRWGILAAYVSVNFAQAVGGTLSFVGGLTARAAFTLLLVGVVSFVGTLAKGIRRSLAGSVSFNGALLKGTAKLITGVIGPSGTLQKGSARALGGALSFAGTVITLANRVKAIAGALSFTGTLSRVYAVGAGVIGSMKRRVAAWLRARGQR